ncbi:MAG: hypothetical protein ACTTHG_01170 [Treponemataceae bacterium]
MNKQKQAYLIIVHNEPELFKTLVELLDFSYNDIFVHVDKKADINLFNDVKTQFSKIYFLKKRNDVRWADISQLKTELDLFEYAKNINDYSFYHLLSGVDLPTKPIEFIHDFFNKNNDKEFFSFINDDLNISDIKNKTSYHYFFMKYFKSNIFILNFFRTLVIKTEKLFKITRKYDIELKKGPNWISCTNNFVCFLLENKKNLLKKFNFTCCCDEIAIHSLLWNSDFKSKIYLNNNGEYSCMRKIDWERGKPYIWKTEDIEELLNSESLFARKFSLKYINIQKYKNRLKEEKNYF